MHFVPLTERFVGLHKRILTRSAGAVVPQSAGSFIRAEREFGFLGVIPDLHLGTSTQINTAVRQGNGFIFQEKFEVVVVGFGGQVKSLAIVHQFAVLDRPMLANVIQAGVMFLFEVLGRQRQVFAGIFGFSAPPAIEVGAIPQSHKPRRRSVRSTG